VGHVTSFARLNLIGRAGYLPSERKADKPPFREAAEEALTRYADQGKIEKESFQLEIPK
jgi:hypothetical protein